MSYVIPTANTLNLPQGFIFQAYANTNFISAFNINLSNNHTWATAQTQCLTLDMNSVGWITTTLVANNQPNSNTNFTTTLTANAQQTAQLLVGSINPTERMLYIQTTFLTQETTNSIVLTAMLRVSAQPVSNTPTFPQLNWVI